MIISCEGGKKDSVHVCIRGRARYETYLVRQKLLPHHEDLLQLVPPLLCPATHSCPTLTQRLKYRRETKRQSSQKHHVKEKSEYIEFGCLSPKVHGYRETTYSLTI